MEKLILLFILLIVSSFWYVISAQTFMNARINTTDTTYEWFITNTNKYTMKAKDSNYVKWKANTFQLLKFDSTRNDGSPTRIAWLDNKGRFKISPASSFTAAIITVSAITSALGGTPIIPTGNSSQYIKGNGTFATFPINVSNFINDAGYLTSVINNTYIAGYGLSYYGTNPKTFSVNVNEIITLQRAIDSIQIVNQRINLKLNITDTLGLRHDLNNKLYISQLPTNLNYFANGPGYISEYTPTLTSPGNYSIGINGGNNIILPTPTLTSNQIISGLTYTPYNSSNPSGYISTIPANTLQIFSNTISIIGGNSIVIPTQTVSTILTAGTNVIISGSYPSFTISTPTQTTDLTAGQIISALSYSPYNNTNPSGYINSVPAQSFLSLTGKPTTILGYGITDAYPLSGNPSSFLTSQVSQILSGSGSNTISLSGGGGSFVIPTTTTSYSGDTGISVTGSIITNTLPHITATISAGTSIGVLSSGNSFTVSNTLPDVNVSLSAGLNTSVTGTYPTFTVGSTNTLTALNASTGISITNGSVVTNTIPDRTVSITAGNANITVSGTYPNFVLTPYSPTSFTVARPINSTTFQPSSTKQAFVFYTIRINCVATIGGASSATVSLQHSNDNGSTWIDDGQLENSNTVSLAIILNSNTTQTSQISAVIPAGAICRLVSSNLGATITYIRGNETY